MRHAIGPPLSVLVLHLENGTTLFKFSVQSPPPRDASGGGTTRWKNIGFGKSQLSPRATVHVTVHDAVGVGKVLHVLSPGSCSITSLEVYELDHGNGGFSNMGISLSRFSARLAIGTFSTIHRV